MANTNLTLVSKDTLGFGGTFYTERYKISGLTANLRANATHTGPEGTEADEITYQQTAECTDGSVVSLVYIGTDTTNNEIDIEFAVPAGGSLDGATFTVFARWQAQARQDSQSIDTDNDV